MFFIIDKTRIPQVTAVIRSLRKLRYEGRCGICVIDTLLERESSALKMIDAEFVFTGKNEMWPPPFLRTALKLWIPFYFDCENYIVMDSDIIVINLDFIKSFNAEADKIKIVRESDIVWEYGLDGISSYHRSIVGKNILQTGMIGFSKANWKSFFPEIVTIMKEEPSNHGDMVAVNMYAYKNLERMLMLEERDNLVLRPTGKGIGTRTHLPFTRFRYGNLYFKDKSVSTVHYTKSGGEVVTFHKLIRDLPLEGYESDDERPRG